MTYWHGLPDHPTDALGSELTGDNGFRLMPGDDLATRPAHGRLDIEAGGYGLLFRYGWEHPDDGPQTGILLVASPGPDDGAVHGTWLDSWHQKPFPLLLTGTAQAGRSCALQGTYAGEWGWQIELDLAPGGGAALALTMRNVVPESALAQAPEEMCDQLKSGPYDVMVMRLARPAR